MRSPKLRGETMTPLHLEILLHYNCCVNDYDQVNTNDTRKEYAYDLARQGLLYTPHNCDQTFMITTYGKKKLEEILAYAEGLTNISPQQA